MKSAFIEPQHIIRVINTKKIYYLISRLNTNIQPVAIFSGGNIP